MGVIVESCWKGYRQAGLKKKGDRMVPNCVPVNENINIPIAVGDVVLGGKFKNKRIVVKSIEKNEKGDITINGKPLLKFRIVKEGEDIIGLCEMGCGPRRKGESEAEYKKRCGGYTYAFPLYMVYKDDPKEPTTPPSDSEAPAEAPADGGDGVSEAYNKGEIYKGKLKIDGKPVEVEVELMGVDNKTRSYITRVIHIDRKYLSRLPKDGILPIPAKIFHRGGWVKVNTKGQFESTNEDLRKWFGKGKTGSSGGGGWDRYGSDGQKLGKCGDGDDGDAYAACLSKEKAAKLGPKGRAAFVRRKRADQKKSGDAKKGGEQKKGQKPTFSKTGASEGIQETIEKVDGKYVVYPKKGGDRLGTHDTYEDALKQLQAIEASKARNEETLNEFAITPLLIKGLIGIITTVGAGLIRAFASIMVNRVIDGAILTYHDIKNIVAPEPYIKFLKGLNKNDKFNKEFIELILSQRKPGAKVLLGSAWENAMTSLPAFVEAFDRFTTQENISKGDKELLLARIQRSMRSSYMSGWRDIHKTLKKKYPELAKDLREEKLNEFNGFRFDAIGYNKDGKQVDMYLPRARFGFEKNIVHAAADKLFKTGISKGNGIKYIEIYYNKHHLGTIRLPRNFTKGKDWDKLPITEIPMDDLQKIDQFADKQLNPLDVVITDKHFFDRLNDPRNGKEISQAELIGFFKRLGKNKKKFVEFLDKYEQIVAVDDRTNINIPFMKQANKAIAKTIMRKKDFKSSTPKLDI
jgi:hypothetical protein